jgi:hypothetical protein
MIARGLRTARALSVSILVCGCAEPSFVSLGRNLSLVQGEDAGAIVPPSSPQVDAAAEDPALYPGVTGMTDPCVPIGENVDVTTDCEGRSLIPCPAPSVGDPDPLAAMLRDLLVMCDGWDVVLSVRFEAGCATGYDLSAPVSPEAPACIDARLSSGRFVCAESVACAAGGNFRPLIN